MKIEPRQKTNTNCSSNDVPYIDKEIDTHTHTREVTFVYVCAHQLLLLEYVVTVSRPRVAHKR